MGRPMSRVVDLLTAEGREPLLNPWPPWPPITQFRRLLWQSSRVMVFYDAPQRVMFALRISVQESFILLLFPLIYACKADVTHPPFSTLVGP